MISENSAYSTFTNCFHQTMRELSFKDSEDAPADLFSRACVEQFEDSPKGHYGYLLAQVFEPYVLAEIADIDGVDPEKMALLEVGESAAISTLRQRVSDRTQLTPVEAVNTAAALISISRFELAQQMLEAGAGQTTSHRDRFEIAMLRFIIHNRFAQKDMMRNDLLAMRQLIESGPLHAERQLDAASQAIVWHLKSNVLSQADFDWFLNLGHTIAAQDGVESGALSSWYRAVAMVPAAQGDKQATRKIMLAARKAADRSMRARPNAYETHFLKTYHESSIKEHMYVTRDYATAIVEGEALIALDPAWSVSYGEVAEVHRHFGEFDAAAEFFEMATRKGPPYVGHHLFCAAQCNEAAGKTDAAIGQFTKLLETSPDNQSVIVSLTKLTQQTNDPRYPALSRKINSLRSSLGKQHLEHLGE